MTALGIDVAAYTAATRDRVGGSRLSMIRAWFHETDPRCVSCGYDTRLDVPKGHARYAVLGHLVPASAYGLANARCGYIPGNIALMCYTCNDDAGDMTFTHDLLIADAFVPTQWPLGKQRKLVSDDVRQSRLARKW